jgi:nitrite reductase (NO-forming)
MRSAVKLTAFAGLLAFGTFMPKAAHAQEPAAFVIDEAAAKKGKALFQARACSGCHTIGKGKMAGPDLAHVTNRRSIEWLKTWLKDPPAMMETDSTAKALLKQYNNMKMPNMKLTEEESMALLSHIAKESLKVKEK